MLASPVAPEAMTRSIAMKSILRTAVLPLGVVAAFAGGVVAAPALADQPYMQRAFNALNNANGLLRNGTPDKGGHRVRAIALTNQAMQEVRLGIEYDRTH
jgi:hypothetical protein